MLLNDAVILHSDDSTCMRMEIELHESVVCMVVEIDFSMAEQRFASHIVHALVAELLDHQIRNIHKQKMHAGTTAVWKVSFERER